MKILVINSGSSSLKYQLFDMTNEGVIAKGNCEKIGMGNSFIKHKANGKETIIDFKMPSHEEAITEVLRLLKSSDYGVIRDLSEISAVGHRVIHGGEIYKESKVVDDKVITDLENMIDLAPLHMPAHILGIKSCRAVMPNVKHIAVFDTAFHSNMPAYSYLYGLPYEAYTKWKVRKYGFHGTSHRFVANEVAKIMNRPLKDLKIITVHLGNGSSVSAVQGGISVDTSMGFTPLEGLIMGTRSGDIDPSVVPFIAEKTGKTAHGVITYLNKESGLLGISGATSDMRELWEEVDKGNERAALAAEMLCYRVKKYIGSYIAVMGGVDAIVFCGGIGENDERVRERVMKDMQCFGIEFDFDKNLKIGRGTIQKLSLPNSKVEVYRLPTDEELVIARDAYALAK